jgi:hypothetical protein
MEQDQGKTASKKGQPVSSMEQVPVSSMELGLCFLQNYNPGKNRAFIIPPNAGKERKWNIATA